MAKLAVVDERNVAATQYPARWNAEGIVEARDLSPEDYPLRMIVGQWDAGATIVWDRAHGDEGLYVLDGELEMSGAICPAGGAVVIESGVPVTISATAPSRVVHCSPRPVEPPTEGLYGPADPDGHGVHVLGPKGWFTSGQLEGVEAIWFTDSTCPTCRIALFSVDHGPGFAGNFHSHSQDEIIYVLDGTVDLGPRGYGPGTAFHIPANVTYRVSYPDGAKFLNFRRDVSETRTGRDGPPVLEGALARGGALVGDFIL